MKENKFTYLVILFSLTGIGATVASLVLIPGMPIGMSVVLFSHFLIILIPAVVLAVSYYSDKKKTVAPHVFGPKPANPSAKKKTASQILMILYLGFGPIAASFFFLINDFAAMAALTVFAAGLLLIATLGSKQRIKKDTEYVQKRFRLYGDSTPIKFESYRFDDESLSKAAEILSASHVSELPADMPYYDKVDRLAKDGSCVIFSSGIGIEAILGGIRNVIARRGLSAPVITKEAVFAQDTEQIRNRRRDGEETETNDLNVIGHLLEGSGFVLLNLMYNPYGRVITVVSTAEMSRLRELTYLDRKDIQRYR